MPRKSAEEELVSFAATLPNYLRNYLEAAGDSGIEDAREYELGDHRRDRALIEQYEVSAAILPDEVRREEDVKRKREMLRALAPSARRGRPRKDADVEEAMKLKSQGKSWPQVGRIQGKSGDAARKLTKSREKHPGK